MERKPKMGETYFYIKDDSVLCRVNNLQDVDIYNGMIGNYYLSEAKARLDLCMRRTNRKDESK